MNEQQPDGHPDVSAIDRVRLDPRLRTRDDSGIVAITLGTLAWAIAWVVLTFTDGEQSWRMITTAGFVMGVIGWIFLVFRRRRKRRLANQE